MHHQEVLAGLTERLDALGLELADVAQRLAALTTTEGQDRESYGPGDAGCRRTEERARFAKAAKRELAELIREIEGPNPPEAPRSNA